MDNATGAIRQQMDNTMAGLNKKVAQLEHQISGTVNIVNDSLNSVRDNLDIKLQVRRRPWTLVAGASLLGFLVGSRGRGYPANDRAANDKSSSTQVRMPSAYRISLKKGIPTNGASPRLDPASNWLSKLGNTFEPELLQVRGMAIAMLLGVAREVIAKQLNKPIEQPVEEEPHTEES